MKNDKSDPKRDGDQADRENKSEKEIIEERIDEEEEQSFPASDPPSYSMPGNDDIKPGKKSIIPKK